MLPRIVPDASRLPGLLRAGALLALAAMPALAFASTLFVATARSYMAADNAIGRLYEVDPATGKARPLGDLRIGKVPVGVNGIARHPRTGVLYGVTLPSGGSFPAHLVTIDTSSGSASAVGPLGATASDINFDAHGRLFAWLSDQRRLAQVDLATGKATALDIPGLAGDSGGLAIDGGGTAFLAVTSGTGRLTRVDLDRRQVLGEVPLSEAPLKASVNSLTFSPEGRLFGVNSDDSLPPRTLLVAIDPASGRVAPVGDLPKDADGLTFSVDAPAAVAAGQATWRAPLAVGGGVVLLLVILARRRRRKPD